MSVIEIFMEPAIYLADEWEAINRLAQRGDGSHLDALADEMRKVSQEETDRCRNYMGDYMAAAHFKRRLGADATREEMAKDKRICKKMSYCGMVAYGSWYGTEHAGQSPEIPTWGQLNEAANSDLECRQRAAVLPAETGVINQLLVSWNNAVGNVTSAAKCGEQKVAQKWAARYAKEQQMLANVIRACDITVSPFVWEIMTKTRR